MTPCGFLKQSNAVEQFIKSHSLFISEILIINAYNLNMLTIVVEHFYFGTLVEINTLN